VSGPPATPIIASGIHALPSVLDDRFELGPIVGQGGMATVFRARDRKTGDTVAVKVLRDDIVPSSGRARFAREVSLTSELRHSGILEIIAAGEADGHPYYVMPFVAGRSLRQVLEKADGGLTISRAIDIAVKVGEALDHAHTKGVIHRDIKPANILLDGERVLLVDFGIARAIDVATGDRLTESGVAIGTAHYMSPEQAAGGRVNAPTDIYSLGCVLYEMLVGTPPFSGSTSQQVLARHAVDKVPSVRVVRRTVSPDLEAAVFRALEKVPADRFATAGEFVAALRSPGILSHGHTAITLSRRTLAAGAAAAAIIVTGLVLTAARDPSLDPNRVLLMPLISSGSDHGGVTVGEDAATMIAAAIDGAGSLRIVDGWRRLSAAQRGDIASVSATDSRNLALAAGAAYVLGGRVVARGDSVDVVLNLLDAGADTAVKRGVGSAPRDEPWRAALRAANGILPALLQTDMLDVGSRWMERPPKAIVAYLQGEAAYRRLRMARALASFREAVSHDSTFALAALRGAQAAGWSHNARQAGDFARIALSQSLSPRDAHFARGFQAYLDGDADSAAAELGRAIALDSTMAIAWMQLAETYTHLLPSVGAVDSIAGAALERAYALDSTAAPIAHHIAERSARAGNAARTGAMLRQLRAAGADTALIAEVDVMHRCVESPRRGLDWSDAARRRPLPLLMAGTKLAAVGGQLGCASDAFLATLRVDTADTPAADGRRFAALLGIVGVRHAQGDVTAATSEIDRFVARWGAGTSLLLRQALLDSSFSSRARGVARSDSTRLGADFRRTPFSARLWQLGMWSATDGRLETAAAVARELQRRADSSGHIRDRRHAQSIDARVALARADTSRAMALLTSLMGAPTHIEDVSWDEFSSMADERLLLARLHLARGEAARALALANVFDSPQPAVFLMYLVPSLELRAQAARVLGDDRLASRYAARVASMRSTLTK
jgi:hypothetical protein